MPNQSNKDLRDFIFDGPESKSKTKVVEIGDKRFECRSPSIGRVQKWAEMQHNPSVADIIIGQVYNPDTGEAVFDDTSRDMISNLPATSPVAKLAEVVASLAEGKVEVDLEGNSQGSDDTD